MKTIIYQHADASIKQPEIRLEFPDVLPDADIRNAAQAECRDEIRIILQHALLEQLRQDGNL